MSRCPHCKNRFERGKTPDEIQLQKKFAPFCSERCKLLDLGAWALEQHRIKGVQKEDLDEISLPSSNEE